MCARSYLELVPGWVSPGLPLRSAPLTTLSGLWRDKLAFWVTSCSILFLMATSRPFREQQRRLKLSCQSSSLNVVTFKILFRVGLRETATLPRSLLVKLVLTFFSFCCWTTWAFLGAIVRPLQNKKTIALSKFPSVMTNYLSNYIINIHLECLSVLNQTGPVEVPRVSSCHPKKNPKKTPPPPPQFWTI